MFLINSIKHNIYITLDQIIPEGSIQVFDQNHHELANRHFKNSIFEKLAMKNITGKLTIIVKFNEAKYSKNIYVK